MSKASEILNNLKEDSAGVFTVLKEISVKDNRGKQITLKKGDRLTHERGGSGWGPDFYLFKGIIIPGESIPDKALSMPEGLFEGADLQCPNCHDNLGKQSEVEANAKESGCRRGEKIELYCSNCGEKFKHTCAYNTKD